VIIGNEVGFERIVGNPDTSGPKLLAKKMLIWALVNRFFSPDYNF